MGFVGRVHQNRHDTHLIAHFTPHIQVLPAIAFGKNHLHGLRQWKSVPSAAFEIQALLHQVPLAPESRFLRVNLHRDLPPRAFLQNIRKKLEVQPQAGLGHIQVLVALVGDHKKQAGFGGQRFVCGIKKREKRSAQGISSAVAQLTWATCSL